MPADQFAHFVESQSKSYETALQELRAGKKQSHWMWFIFPQLKHLGRSERAKYFGLENKAEAAAYLAHDPLGPRLRTCSEAVLRHTDTPADVILGYVDALKLRSSATLFAAVDQPNSLFSQILAVFYQGHACPETEAILKQG